MNPDVERALPGLVERGLLAPEKAGIAMRLARGELISVRPELRLALYVGVLMIMGGVGVLVKENLDRIGPVAIAVGIGLAALGAFVWVLRNAEPFSWGESSSPHLAFDYILLLGVLLVGADLAYIEWKLTPLGANWSWHLLFMALFAGGCALRFDSRTLFSLALSSFAAWRGVAVGFAAVTSVLRRDPTNEVCWNAIVCGLLFATLGTVCKWTLRKPHFEPVATYLGWLLVLAALAARGFQSGDDRQVWGLALLIVGVGLAVLAVRTRRFWLFTLAVLGAYLGLNQCIVSSHFLDALGPLMCGWFLWTAGAVLVLLIVMYRRLGGSHEP